MKDFIKRAFPVPGILIPATLAINISDGRLRYFEFARKNNKFTPKDFGQIPFPQIRLGVDEKEIEEARDALVAFAKKHGDPAVRVVVHEAEAYVFRTSVPTINTHEIRSAIESGLEENVPIPLSEAVFEYSIARVDEIRRETIVAVSVIPKKNLLSVLGLFLSAGLKPVSFETESRALSRSLFNEDDHSAHAVLSINTHHSMVFIVQDGVVSFSSSIEVGSHDMDVAVSKTFNIEIPKASLLIHEKAFLREQDNMEIFDAMIPVFSTIHDELNKVLAYWKSREKKEPEIEKITDIVFTGSYSLVSGLSQYISLGTKLPVVQGSVWTRTGISVDTISNLSYRDSLDYGAVIGALL